MKDRIAQGRQDVKKSTGAADKLGCDTPRRIQDECKQPKKHLQCVYVVGTLYIAYAHCVHAEGAKLWQRQLQEMIV